MSSSPREQVPLPRLLSKWCIASRKEAEALVRAGRVRVNGQIRRGVLDWVDPARDVIEVDGARVQQVASEFQWLALNKPRGVVTTTKDEAGRPTVMGLIGREAAAGLAPIGRLDQASTGLILLTNDHETAQRLLDPEHKVEKCYRVKVAAAITDAELERLREPMVTDEGERLGPMRVGLERASERSTWLEVRLTEGKNRQIRRRIEALGHEVLHLVRTRFGPIELGSLEPGKHRPLNASERRALGAFRARGTSG